MDSAVTILNSDYDAFDALLHNICTSSELFCGFSDILTSLFLDEKTQNDNWFKPSSDSVATGVCLRVENGFFRVFPYENAALIPFEENVRKLNPAVAVKLRSASVHAALRRV